MSRRVLLCLVLTLVAALAGATLRVTWAETEESAPPAPDFEYYLARVAPIAHGNCAECHANPRKRLGRHFLRPAEGRRVRERDHERNFETILGLIVPGDPSKSLWLLKPLGPQQGGVEHGGGQRIRFDGIEYAAMVDFINGVRLPPDPADAAEAPPAGPPEIGREGSTLPASAFQVAGDVVRGQDGALISGPEGGTAEITVRLDAERTWRVEFEVEGPGTALLWRVDERLTHRTTVAATGPSLIGTPRLVDGRAPLVAPRGDLSVDAGRLSLSGASDRAASFLSAFDETHRAVEAVVHLPSEDEGADDALLLFGMLDADNGHFLGLADGGRRVIMGVLEGGVERVLSSARASTAEDDAPRTLRVDLLESVAVGRLDGRALVFLHLESAPEARGLGFLSHGRATVASLGAREDWEVYTSDFGLAPVALLRAGNHRFRLTLPPGAPAVRGLSIRPHRP